MIELKCYGITKYCMLDKATGKTSFSKISRVPGFTGLYFEDDANFFAIYPTKSGPTIYFDKREYLLNKKLNISLQKTGKNRKFRIVDYRIEIDYVESPYIGWDAWSEEEDVDLFYMVEQNYKKDSFYEEFTLKT
jgi:hypothetical protein